MNEPLSLLSVVVPPMKLEQRLQLIRINVLLNTRILQFRSTSACFPVRDMIKFLSSRHFWSQEPTVEIMAGC